VKRPSFQFYPADWRKDAALQSCSMAAQGLWINLMCIAHECEPYGHLVVNGKPMLPAQIARLVGLSAKECERLLDELLDAGVSASNQEGAFYSRRMVRDEEVRNRRAEGGKAGSEFGKLGAEHGRKGGRPRKETGDKKPPFNPPPSSSSSSSTSVNTPPPPTREAASSEVFPIAEDWQPSPAFTTQAKLLGLPVLDAQAMAEGTSEFVAYWLTRPGELRTQAQWENALAQSLKRRQLKADETSTRQATVGRPQRQATATRTPNHGGHDAVEPA